jgi:LPS sulfotransferase NodH
MTGRAHDTEQQRMPEARLDWHPHFGAIGGKSLVAWLADYAAGDPPVDSIVVASEERSGSEWFCQLLGATGRLGRPSEYLNTYWMRRFIADYPEDVPGQLAVAHRVGTTTNRRFAMKTHLVQLRRLVNEAAFDEAFPAAVFVRLIRRDLVAQAVSLYRARFDNQYHAHVAAARHVAFDADAINRMLMELARTRCGWEVYFARTGTRPIVIAYEDLTADPLRAVSAVACHVGEQITRADISLPRPLVIQRDPVSEQWRDRFLAECGSRNHIEAI